MARHASNYESQTIIILAEGPYQHGSTLPNNTKTLYLWSDEDVRDGDMLLDPFAHGQQRQRLEHGHRVFVAWKRRQTTMGKQNEVKCTIPSANINVRLEVVCCSLAVIIHHMISHQ